MDVNTKLRHVRQREGLSPRSMARRLRISIPEYELLESNAHQLTVNELIDCCEAMNVPIVELFDPPADVPPRANVVRAYKSALTLKRLAATHAQNVHADRLIADLLKIMPEMAHARTFGEGVKGWQVVGHRRGPSDISKREECPIDTSFVGAEATYGHA